MKDWETWDKEFCWHPFTQQREWHEQTPLFISSGKGVWLFDEEGNQYIDGNSSIWTNIHGHNRPEINQAINQQLQKFAHISYLGSAHKGASTLAQKLISFFPSQTLKRVFFSDDGSTSIECALRMELQYRHLLGEKKRRKFLSFSGAYHGDTLGCVSLGGVPRFFQFLEGLGAETLRVSSLEDIQNLSPSQREEIAAVVIEPLIQGVNKMHLWEKGMLSKLREWCNASNIHLIFDEVMTGFGRTGKMFACQHEEVFPDFLCLAKGISGGYLPLAATLTTEKIYAAFLGDYKEEKTFCYGHSYTANALGCAAALASLEIFEKEKILQHLPEKIAYFEQTLLSLKENQPEIWDIRQIGLIAGIELRRPNGIPFSDSERMGERICFEARKHQLLTRPIQDTIILMPPLCISTEEISLCAEALQKSLQGIKT